MLLSNSVTYLGETQMQWPMFDPVVFGNMVISGLVGFVFGLGSGWWAHYWTDRRERRDQKLSELRDRRDKKERIYESVKTKREEKEGALKNLEPFWKYGLGSTDRKVIQIFSDSSNDPVDTLGVEIEDLRNQEKNLSEDIDSLSNQIDELLG